MEDVMRELTDAEIHYLGNQGLGRLATVGEDGYPRVVPVAFYYNPEAGAIDIRGRGVTGRELFRDVRRTGVAALVVDDVLPPQRPRAVQGCGDAVMLDTGGKALREDFDDQIIRLSPRRVGSWGLEPEAPSAARRSLPRGLMAFFADIRPWIVLLTGLLAWLVASCSPPASSTIGRRAASRWLEGLGRCRGPPPTRSGRKVRRVLMPGAHPQISTISR